MTYLIISIFVIVIILMLNSQRISHYFENRQEQQEIDFKERTNLDLWKLTKLSPGITWLGSDQFHFSNPEFYFDNAFLYLIDYNTVIKHTIKSVIEVTRTDYTRNDRRIWKIVINESDSQIVYKIVTNHSLTTSNFGNFLDKVNENPDSVVDSEWLLKI
jgi:hypothetical protein